MQLLSGMQPGSLDDKGEYPKQSFNYRIQQRIEKLQSMQRKFMHTGAGDQGQAAMDDEK